MMIVISLFLFMSHINLARLLEGLTIWPCYFQLSSHCWVSIAYRIKPKALPGCTSSTSPTLLHWLYSPLLSAIISYFIHKKFLNFQVLPWLQHLSFSNRKIPAHFLKAQNHPLCSAFLSSCRAALVTCGLYGRTLHKSPRQGEQPRTKLEASSLHRNPGSVSF